MGSAELAWTRDAAAADPAAPALPRRTITPADEDLVPRDRPTLDDVADAAVLSSVETAPLRPTVETTLTDQRILVVGINFAPEVTGIGPYTADLCDALVGVGAKVEVVTGQPHYPHWRRFHSGDDHRSGDVRVRRVQHYVPSRQDALRRALYELSFWTTSRLEMRGMTADAVVAVSPSLGAVPAAAAFARRRGIPLGVIVQDLVGLGATQSGIPGGRRIGRSVSAFERHYLAKADRVGVVSQAFVEPLTQNGIMRDRIALVPNYVHIRPTTLTKAEARRALGWRQDAFIASHTGNMGFKQDLGNVVATARLAASAVPSLTFKMIGDGATRAELQRAADGLPNLDILPPVSDRTYPLVLAASDVLIVNERGSVEGMCLPSKLTSYMSAGRPVVGACNEHGATAAMIRESDAGMVVPAAQPSALLTALVTLLRHPELAAAHSEAAQRWAQVQLRQEHGRQRLLTFVDGLLPR